MSTALQYVLLNGFGADLVEVQGPRGASAWMIISVFKEGQVDALIGAGFQGRQGGNPMAYDAQLRVTDSVDFALACWTLFHPGHGAFR